MTTRSLTPSLVLFLRSASHFSTHLVIFPRETSLPTFTVAIIFPHSNDSAKHVNSKNDECSEYGTGTICTDEELLLRPAEAARRFAKLNPFSWHLEITEGIDGDCSAPFGGVKLEEMKFGKYNDWKIDLTHVHPVGRNPTTLVNSPLKRSTYSWSLSDDIIPRGRTWTFASSGSEVSNACSSGSA